MAILLGLILDNVVTQETLLNLLLRNYLHYNLYDQAEKLRSKAPRFEAHSNQQVTFYLSVHQFSLYICSAMHVEYSYLTVLS